GRTSSSRTRSGRDRSGRTAAGRTPAPRPRTRRAPGPCFGPAATGSWRGHHDGGGDRCAGVGGQGLTGHLRAPGGSGRARRNVAVVEPLGLPGVPGFTERLVRAVRARAEGVDEV